MSFDPGTPLGPRGRQVQTETTGLRDGLSYTKKWFAKEKREREEPQTWLPFRGSFSSKNERWTDDLRVVPSTCSLMFEDT